MIKKFMQYLLLCVVLTIGLIAIPPAVRADFTLAELRIAATIATEISGNVSAAKMVGAVIKVRHDGQLKYKATWADILYGTDEFQNSRGLASKNKEELQKYIRTKAGNKWEDIIGIAQQVYNGTISKSEITKTYKGKQYVLNSFLVNHKDKDIYKNNRLIKTGTVTKDAAGHDYFWQEIGNFQRYGNYVRFDENNPDASHKYDSNYINKNIKGTVGTYTGSSSTGGTSTGGTSTGSSSTGSSRSPARHEKSEGHDNAEMCSMDNIRKSYGSDATSCWYCDVVIILTNSYLSAAGRALPSAIALGQIILKLGFLIWLAYYILQQVSSFTPVAPSKMLQDILVMGFKVALASVVVDAANAVIVEYFINPIGELGTDYGMALYDKLLPAG